MDRELLQAHEGGSYCVGQADALGTPGWEEKKDGGRAEVRVDASGGGGSGESGGDCDGWEMGAEESIPAAGGGDEDGFVGGKVGGSRCFEGGDGGCGCRGLVDVLLEGCVDEGILEEGVGWDGRWRSGWERCL